MQSDSRFRATAGLTSLALVLYAVSAALGSLSAGLFILAVEAARRRDPITAALGVAAGWVLAAGMVLAAASFPILLWAFRRFHPRRLGLGGADATAFHEARLLLFAGAGLLAPAAILTFFGFAFRGGLRFSLSGLYVSAAAALAFFVAVAVIPFRSGGPFERSVSALALAIGSIGIAGELILALRVTLDPTVPRDWITFGGYPIVNWNVPFGAAVAASAFLLAWSHWRIARGVTAAPSPGLGGPARDL